MLTLHFQQHDRERCFVRNTESVLRLSTAAEPTSVCKAGSFYIRVSACLEKSRERDVLDAEDGFGEPVGRAGPRAPRHRRRQKTPGRVRHAPRSPPAAARGGRPTRGGSYVHAVRRAAWRRQPRVKGAGDPRFWFASRTGCERRTLGRPPSCQDVLRCARSAGREERRRGEACDKPGGSGRAPSLPTELG